MDNSLLAVRDINHKYIVVERKKNETNDFGIRLSETERIASDVGHLSNEDSAIYMSTLVGEKTKQIFLAHLSEEANTPELALKAYEKKFKKYHIDLDKIEIRTTSQKESICGGNKNEL